MRHMRIDIYKAMDSINKLYYSEKDYLIALYDKKTDLEYIDLINALHACENILEKNQLWRQFRGFFKIRRSDKFMDRFFSLYNKYYGEEIDYKNLMVEVLEAFHSIKHNNKNNWEYSYASKLLHILDQTLPMIDSRIEAFLKSIYCINIDRTSSNKTAFYNDLIDLYNKILKVPNNIVFDLRKRLYGNLIPQTCLGNTKILDTFMYSLGSTWEKRISMLKKCQITQ